MGQFNKPQFGVYGTKTFSCGQKGDIVVLKKKIWNRGVSPPVDITTCGSTTSPVVAGIDGGTSVEAITTSSYAVGASTSAKMTLEEYDVDPLNTGTFGDEKGGAALVSAIATGKVNELPIGEYKICYATKNSEGNDVNDFKMLTREIEILPGTSTRPTMTVPMSVMRGTDIIVHWTSTAQLQTKNQAANSWIGLFPKGACMPGTQGSEWADNEVLKSQMFNTQADFATAHGPAKYIEKNPHECYVAQAFIEAGVGSGVVRFSQAEYKNGGEYDVRFFQGDSRNVQGRVCKGLTNVPSETYLQCELEAALISSSVHVFNQINEVDKFDAVPGIEVVFAEGRGRRTAARAGTRL